MLVAGNTAHPKLGNVYRTYRPVGKTCPSECPLLNNGCYAQSGPTAIHAKRSEDSADWKAKLLSLPAKSCVRYLVSGDWFLDDQPDWETISAILEVHAKRPDLRGWSYTHGWRRLDAALFNALSNLTVNASTEAEEDALRAVANGWPTVRVVPHDFPKRVETDQVVYLVCPNQTNKTVTCDRCRLCMRKDRTINGKPVVVAFRAHGPRKRRVEAVVGG